MGTFLKHFFILVILLLTGTLANAQNVGIGTTNPQTRLHIAGALGFVADSAAAAAADTIPDNVSVYRIMNAPGGVRSGLMVVHPKEGQLLTIYNEDDNDAIFAGSIVSASGGVNYFIYLNGAWRLISSNSVAGPAGPTGADGPIGATGVTGSNGSNGTTGLAGATGATGAVGSNGTNGTNGTNGITGSTGITGATGAVGSNGTNGTNGTNGINGAIGITGPTGVVGNNGTNGVTGPTGAVGSNGTNGTNGVTGVTGATGAVGSNGTNGTNGTNGVTGVTGATGTAGSANAWGLTGNTGTVAGNNFIGTIDGMAWVIKTNNTERARVTSYGDMVIGSGDSTASVNGNTLRAPNVLAGTTNATGADLTVSPGNGTGNAGSGSIIFKTAPAGSSGTAIDAMAETMRITSTGAISFAGATNFGSPGSMLRSAGNGTPVWSTATYPNTTTINQLLYSSAANTVTGLAAGTTGQILTTNSSGTPVWTTATYPATTTINQVLFSSAANTVTGIAAGTTNEVLTSNSSGVPGWGSVASAANGAFILNQTSQQTSANYNIDGSGAVGKNINVGANVNAGNRVAAKAFNGKVNSPSTGTSVALDSTDFFVVITAAVPSSGSTFTVSLPNPSKDYPGHILIIRHATTSGNSVVVQSFDGSTKDIVPENTSTASGNPVKSITDTGSNQGAVMLITDGTFWYEISGSASASW